MCPTRLPQHSGSHCSTDDPLNPDLRKGDLTKAATLKNLLGRPPRQGGG